MKPFSVLSTETIIKEPYCHIDRQKVELPNGVITDWWIRVGSDVILVIPYMEDGKVMLQRNYKHGCGEVVLELCAGLIDEGETPKQACVRELQEELGLTAKCIEFLGKMYTSPTGSRQMYHVFMAINAAKTHNTNWDDAEQIEPFLVSSLPAAIDQVLAGNYPTSSATLAALLMADQYQKKNDR